MTKGLLLVMSAALFVVLGSRLEIARVQQSQPQLTPAACELYIDSRRIGALGVDLPIAIEQPDRFGTSVVQEVQAEVVKRSKK